MCIRDSGSDGVAADGHAAVIDLTGIDINHLAVPDHQIGRSLTLRNGCLLYTSLHMETRGDEIAVLVAMVAADATHQHQFIVPVVGCLLYTSVHGQKQDYG